MDVNKKDKTIIILLNVCMLIVFLLIIVCFMLFIGTGKVPKLMLSNKTAFDSYDEFRKTTSDFFPNKLPETSKDIMYKYLDSNGEDIFAVSFICEEKDVKSVLNDYRDYFSEECAVDETITKNQIQSDNIIFIEEFIKNDMKNYKYKFYRKSDAGNFYTIYAVVNNIENNQIIIFYYKKANLGTK